MTHPTYEELNDFNDGLAGAEVSARVQAHLATCDACRHTLDVLHGLHSEAGAVARERDVPAFVWDRVWEQTIAHPQQQTRRALWHARYALAAAAVVLVVLGSSLTLWLGGDRNHAQPVATTNPPHATLHANVVAYKAVEADYAKTADALIVLLEQRRSSMDTTVVRTVEENLKIMDQAIGRAREALMSDPTNKDIAEALASAHQARIHMLNRAVRMRKL